MAEDSEYKDYLSNIKKIYILAFFRMFLVLIPVLIPYFSSLGLSMKQIFELQAIFGISVALLEIPSGYMADLFGRKRVICLGSFISGIAFTWLCFIESYPQLILYQVFLGISLSLISGADISILYDSLNYKNEDRSERTKAMANIQMASVSAESIASILGGLLVALSFNAVLKTHAFFAWIPFIISLTLIEPPYKKMNNKEHYQNFKKVLAHIFRTEKLLTLIFTNLFIWGLSTFTAVWIFQKYWQEENINLVYFGVLWATYNFTVGVVGKQVHWLEKKFGPIPLLLTLALLPLVGYFGMAFSAGWFGVILGFSFQISRGINQVILQDALNWRTPSEFRATANSLSSFFFRLGFALIGPLVGYFIDKKGLSTSLTSLGFLFSFCFFFFMLPLIKNVSSISPASIPRE